MNPEKFILELSKHNFKLTDQQIEQFKIYFNYLIEVNEHVNLTRITEENEVYLKHFLTVLRHYLPLAMSLRMGRRFVMLVLVQDFLQFR